MLDVRKAGEFARGHFAQSVNIPLEELPARMYELPEKGASLRVYHDRPELLRAAADLLGSRGYPITAVSHLPLTDCGASSLRLWQPSPFLEKALAIAPSRGRALDIACGSGREAVFLALRGWQVDAVDILPDALANASALARRHGVEIRTLQRDIGRDGLPSDVRYELVTIFRYWHADLLSMASGALAPGGLVAVETFHPADPMRKGKSVTPDDLRIAGKGLDVRIAETCERNGRVFTQFAAVKA